MLIFWIMLDLDMDFLDGILCMVIYMISGLYMLEKELLCVLMDV